MKTNVFTLLALLLLTSTFPYTALAQPIFLDSFEGIDECTVSTWNGGTTGTPMAGSPPAVARVSGLCGMRLEAAGSVTDNTPGSLAAITLRFYILADLNSGVPVILEGFSADDAGGSSLFTVRFDGSNFVFEASTFDSVNVPASAGWNMIELAWNGSGSGFLDYWVNDNATTEDATGSVPAAAGSLESVVLGTSDALDGAITFDDYEARETGPIGPLTNGDANNDTNVNSGDLVSVINEWQSGSVVLAPGTPDCNLDGNVNSDDLDCIINTWLGSTP